MLSSVLNPLLGYLNLSNALALYKSCLLEYHLAVQRLAPSNYKGPRPSLQVSDDGSLLLSQSKLYRTSQIKEVWL